MKFLRRNPILVASHHELIFSYKASFGPPLSWIIGFGFRKCYPFPTSIIRELIKKGSAIVL